MEKKSSVKIVVKASIRKSPAEVWELWTKPEHVTKWNQASEDWHTPRAESNLTVNGRFTFRMESKDGRMGFDFGGVYTEIVENEEIVYIIDDGRRVRISFFDDAGTTRIVEEFEAESTNPIDMQRNGWQAILNSFKKYAESLK